MAITNFNTQLKSAQVPTYETKKQVDTKDLAKFARVQFENHSRKFKVARLMGSLANKVLVVDDLIGKSLVCCLVAFC